MRKSSFSFPRTRSTVIPAKAGIQVLCLAIFVTLMSCTSNKPASAQTLGPTKTEDHYWRWNVKTMKDEPNNNWQTRYGMPYQQHFTLRELTEFKPKEQLEDDTGIFIPIGRIQHYQPRLRVESFLHEYQVINVEAKIVGYNLEDADGDIHLILSDSDGKHTLIAEVPDSNQVSTWAQPQVAAVRKWLYDSLGKPPRTTKRPPRDLGIVFVVGVPFFDKKHGAVGEAPNGIEIHPVLGISLPDDN